MKYHLYYLRDDLAALESAGKLNLERILDVLENALGYVNFRSRLKTHSVFSYFPPEIIN